MRYIPDNNTLMTYIPNVVTAVEGEKDLFTKMQSHLEIAEAWLEANVVKYDDIHENESAMTYAKIIVADDAFRRAIPSLDVILTENGFGIVSNGNVAPASRDRINALLDGLQAQVDEAIEALDAILNGAVLGGTVFKGYEAQRQQEVAKDFFARWRADKPKIIAKEDSIAEKVISQEVLQRLRNVAYNGSSAIEEIILQIKVQHLVIGELTGKMADFAIKATVREMVDLIRKHPDTFPNWENSEAAKYWADYTYKNDKNSGGYWL